MAAAPLAPVEAELWTHLGIFKGRLVGAGREAHGGVITLYINWEKEAWRASR